MAESGGVIHVKGTDGTTKDVTLYTDITDVTEVYKEFKYNGATVYASTTTERTDELATELAYLDGSGVSHYLLISTPSQGVTRDDRTPSDLTSLFADEIANQYGGNVWKLVTDKNNAESLVVGDWIPTDLTYNGTVYTFNMEISCINCYEGECYDNDNPVDDGSADGAVTKIPSHIDLISKETFYDYSNYKNNCWNVSGYNSSSDNKCPWCGCDLYKFLNNTLFYCLPQEVQDVVIEKCMLVEQREYQATTPYGECWQPIGKLWLPNEKEIFGNISYSSSTYGAYGIQYETLNTTDKRTKKEINSSSSFYWWSLSPCSGDNLYVVGVYGSGGRNNNGANDGYNFPVCFRVLLS